MNSQEQGAVAPLRCLAHSERSDAVGSQQRHKPQLRQQRRKGVKLHKHAKVKDSVFAMLIHLYKTFFALFAMSLGVFGLSMIPDVGLKKRQTPEHVELAHQLNSEVIEKFSQKYNLLPIAVDAGLAGGKVYLLGVRFQMTGPKTIDELRCMLVECIELYKTTLNSCDEIRPYFRDGNFDENNITLAIFIDDDNGYPVEPPKIRIASAFCGSVDFITRERATYAPLVKVLSETYEEAYNIVKSQNGG